MGAATLGEHACVTFYPARDWLLERAPRVDLCTRVLNFNCGNAPRHTVRALLICFRMNKIFNEPEEGLSIGDASDRG